MAPSIAAVMSCRVSLKLMIARNLKHTHLDGTCRRATLVMHQSITIFEHEGLLRCHQLWTALM